LALGYEDLNDHEPLRHDPLLAVLVEKADPEGEGRRRERDQGQALAGKSTLNRLELTGAEVREDERYKKIALEEAAVDRMLVAVFLQAHREAPPEIVLDLDCTDDPLHGEQEGRAGGAILPRLLRALLLPAAVHLLRRASARRALTAGESRRGGRQRRGSGADRGADARRVARGADHRARRLRVLSGRTDGVV